MSVKFLIDAPILTGNVESVLLNRNDRDESEPCFDQLTEIITAGSVANVMAHRTHALVAVYIV